MRVDLRTDQGFGRRVTDWELKGVPLRIEIGPRDVANGEVIVVRREHGREGFCVDRAGGNDRRAKAAEPT